MSRIPDELIDQIRDAADIVAIIGEAVDIKRTGADYRGPCPFHGGTHRNFSVSPKRGSFYCFVCHEKGDVFSYLMKRLGLDYPAAVREVGRRAGITVPEDGPVSSDPREPLFQAIAVAQEWFARQLLENPNAAEARRYIEARHLPIDSAGELGLGFAPAGRAFIEAMKPLGIPDETLVDAGLVVRREDGSLGARFRSRLLFPIADLRSRAVGFGGRLIGPGEPKYLNSPETPIFRKGTLLYNLNLAKHEIRKEGKAIVVEGYFDAIRLALAGIENVVAPLGTAMTPDQAVLLARYARSVVLMYDNDPAGLKATFRTGDELLRQSVNVSVATLPPGEDPDSVVLKGGRKTAETFIADAIDLMERKIQILAKHGWLEGIEHRRSALDKLLPTIRAAREAITRDMYLTLAARHIGVSRETLEAEVAFAPTVRPLATQSVVVPGSSEPHEPADPWRRPGVRSERNLIHILLRYPDWRERARDEVRLTWFTCEEYAEIFTAVSGPHSDPADLQEVALSARARLALQHLLNAESFLGLKVDEDYVALCLELEARPHIETFKQQRALIRAERDIERQKDLHAEMVRLQDHIRELFPLPWLRHIYRRGLLRKLEPRRRPQRLAQVDPERQRNVS